MTLDQVNWLGNIEACIYIPGSLLTPVLVRRIGLRRTVRTFLCAYHYHGGKLRTVLQCEIGAVSLLLSAWIRYSGTPRSLTTDQAYGLLMLGQVRLDYRLQVVPLQATKKRVPSSSRPWRSPSSKLLGLRTQSRGSISRDGRLPLWLLLLVRTSSYSTRYRLC